MIRRSLEERNELIKLLNNPSFDNTRNELNADLFVNNLKNTLKGFGFNPKVTYNVYRSVTVYNVSWMDDKDYNDFKDNKDEIALALGIKKEELKINKVSDNEAKIKVPNMKKDILSLKELLFDYKLNDNIDIPLGLDDEDNIITYDFDNDGSLLVTGVSGTGKTNLFRNIIMNTLINYENSKIILLDSQGINYNDFDGVCEVINDENLIINRIKEIRKEFEDRIENNDFSRDKIIVFIDEIYEILELSNSVDEDINYLVQEGNKANISFIVSTDSILSDNIKRIFTNKEVTKLSFYLTSNEEYNLFLNKKVNVPLHNDGVYLETDNDFSKLMIPLVNDEEVSNIVNELKEE